MKGNKDVIKHLNTILKNELVAINQYFLHAKIFQDQGFTKLAAHSKAESIDEMKHADIIIERILFLKGVPNMTDYKTLRIGAKVEDMIKNDLDLEVEAIADLKSAIDCAIQNNDVGTKEILETILVSEEDHYDFLETQIDLIKNVGLQNYLATQI